MPPKAEMTREKIVQAAFHIVREQGSEAVTARNIATQLNCSTRPIYHAYANMEELEAELYGLAVEYSSRFIRTYEDPGNSHAMNLTNGILTLAHREGNMFRFVFLTKHDGHFLKQRRNTFRQELFHAFTQIDPRLGALDPSRQENMFLKLTAYVIGIGALITIQTLELNVESTQAMVIEMYASLLAKEGITD